MMPSRRRSTRRRNARFERAGRGRRRLGEDVASRRAAPELVGAELLAVDELLVAEADRERHDLDAVALDQVVGRSHALSVTTRTPMAPPGCWPRFDRRRVSIVTPSTLSVRRHADGGFGPVGGAAPPSADSGANSDQRSSSSRTWSAAATAKNSASRPLRRRRSSRARPGVRPPESPAIIHDTTATSPPAASERGERVDLLPAVDVPEPATQHDDRSTAAPLYARQRDRETLDAERGSRARTPARC